jgi:hypothetical protein
MQFRIGFLRITFTSSYGIRENWSSNGRTSRRDSIRISRFVTDLSGLGHESCTPDSADLL